MARRRRRSPWGRPIALALLLAGWGGAVQASRVVLRIQAGNPIDKEQRIEIKSNLPEGVRTNHILGLGGLELGYDVKNDLYYVHREMALAPKQIVVFDVEIDDIWVIPPEALTELRNHTDRMVELLRDRPPHETALALQREIDAKIEGIETLQAATRIGPGVPPLEHIRAFQSNQEALKRVRIDVGRMENLVLGTGQDPGGMLGEDRRSPKPERFLEASIAYTNTAMVRIVVENTSPNRRRTVPVRQDLPEEIREFDVLDAGGLNIGTDPDRGVAYVYLQTLDLEPRERRVFTVLIRDKWDVNTPRVGALRVTAEDLLQRVSARERYHSIEDALRELLGALDGVAAEPAPETVDAAYVAFHRTQAAALDEIENKMNRIVMALPQIERTTQLGFRVKAPSARTTWLIIYIILGFLAVMSVIFYFRWYGRTRAERLDEGPPSDG